MQSLFCHHAQTHKTIDCVIGNTPLVSICGLNLNSGVQFFTKCGYFNPGESIKERVAVYLIDEIESTAIDEG